MPTIGEQLKLARETRKLTIKQVVQVIRVRSHYLIAMEADDFAAMPSTAQTRGFLRLYSEFLGLDADNLINQLGNNTGFENTPKQAAVRSAPSPLSEPAAKPKPAPEIPENRTAPITENIEPPETASPLARSNEIFAEIGIVLRNRRELISLTLDEVERHTHVRRQNLELIETGDFDKLASPVQLRGTLGAYASFLDLDADALLLRYADGIQSRRIERQASDLPKSSMQKARVGLPIWVKRFVSPDLIFGGSMILILLALSIWGAQRILAGNASLQQTTPTQGPSISDVLLASPAAQQTTLAGPTSILDEGTLLPTLEPAQISPSLAPAATTSSAVQITVVVL